MSITVPPDSTPSGQRGSSISFWRGVLADLTRKVLSMLEGEGCFDSGSWSVLGVGERVSTGASVSLSLDTGSKAVDDGDREGGVAILCSLLRESEGYLFVPREWFW